MNWLIITFGVLLVAIAACPLAIMLIKHKNNALQRAKEDQNESPRN